MSETLSEHDAFGHWLSGFCDGEGHFSLYHNRQAHSSFAMAVRADDEAVPQLLQKFWGGIGSRWRQDERGTSKPQAWIRIAGIRELHGAVLPHFRTFPLRTRKNHQFRLWAEAVELHHAVSLRAFSLRGVGNGSGRGAKWLAQEKAIYLRLVEALQTKRIFQNRSTDPPTIWHPDDAWKHWLAGFIAAEGHMGIELSESQRRLRPAVSFSVTQRADDTAIIKGIARFFDGPPVSFAIPTRGELCTTARIRRPEHLAATVIPFLDQYPLRAKKAAEYPLWRKAVLLCLEAGSRHYKQVPEGERSRHKGFPTTWRPCETDHFLSLKEQISQLREYREP